jgi:hypothetical protein
MAAVVDHPGMRQQADSLYELRHVRLSAQGSRLWASAGSGLWALGFRPAPAVGFWLSALGLGP